MFFLRFHRGFYKKTLYLHTVYNINNVNLWKISL